MSEQEKREDPQFVVESRDDLAELLDRAGNWAERDVGADVIAAEFRQARDFVEDEPELVTDGGVDRSESEGHHTEPCANCARPVVTTVGMDNHVVVRYNGVTEYSEEYYCNESCLTEEVA